MKIVLIPGMDGTGLLFAPFIEVVPDEIEVISLPLLQRSDADYHDQAQHIIANIGEDPIVLIAESYSGMVAYSMLQIGSPNIKHIIFVASFLECPSRLAQFAKYLPLTVLKRNILPKPILSKLLFGQFSDTRLVSLFNKSLNSVSEHVLKSRINHIAKLNDHTIEIEVPCSYIRPKNDNLVSKRALEAFKRRCQKLVIHEVEGTHFVLQTNPTKCWQIIQNIIE
ncbi:alpha/beta fold hydrolase [Vibrio azureus]|uniref:Serine aminopeptidase S33 domain-containing protein n=1 Tax=Vibrio azureus NBRC 104587 TaxID=1219077 RepID=U3ATQ0_9VIBR|nr:alpha/beta hydrolase [Vibrio azureus]GAD76617.1 hypothetical protein VAZ01S_048_00240 [Vibrio azureus NBRC 104587]